MSKRTREKNFWRKYGISNPKKAPDSWTVFGCRHGSTTDEDLDHFTQKVKLVEVVILDENEVTNEGIRHLARLESLMELDVKGLQIDDACIPDLLTLKSLKWLQIKATRISPEGVEMLLAGLGNLTTLLFTLGENEEEFGEKLQRKYPHCELIISYG